MTTDTGDDLKPIRFTATVRRGLALVLALLDAEQDPTRPPIQTIIDSFNAAEAREYERALAWIRQNSEGKETL